jgi:hypothetical protein
VFFKRGLTLSTSIIAAAVSANSIHAAPIGLATSVTAAAVKGTAVTATTLTLVAGALKVTAWTKAKLAAVIGAVLVVATGTTTVVFDHFKSSPIDAYLSDPELTGFRKAPPLLLIQPTHIAKMKGREITLARNENGKRVGRCVWLGSMISDAYGFNLQRIVFTTGTPTNYYDYLVTVADPQARNFRKKSKESPAMWAEKKHAQWTCCC